MTHSIDIPLLKLKGEKHETRVIDPDSRHCDVKTIQIQITHPLPFQRNTSIPRAQQVNQVSK
jgi:hypothetical protein